MRHQQHEAGTSGAGMEDFGFRIEQKEEDEDMIQAMREPRRIFSPSESSINSNTMQFQRRLTTQQKEEPREHMVAKDKQLSSIKESELFSVRNS